MIQRGNLGEYYFSCFVYMYAWLRRRQWHLTPVFCLENPMDGGAW